MSGFTFTPESHEQAKAHIAKYPAGREQSAVMPLLDIAQRQNGGWLSAGAIEYVADYLNLPVIRVQEVASFYTMYNLKPVGKHLVQVCTTTPCWLRGSDDVMSACRKNLGIDVGDTTEDGLFTFLEVECLGACVNAPMMQINDDYFEDLDADSTEKVLNALRRGEQPATGPQNGRNKSEAITGWTTLKAAPTTAPGGEG